MTMQKDGLKFNAKNIIALTITGVAAFVTLFVTIKSNNDEKIGDLITKSIIPLIGTWMGAIIAYFFAKEHFDAASAQYDRVIDKLTPEKKLQSIKVTDTMIPLNKIVWSDYSEFLGKSIISDILENPSYKGFNRFLFFQKNKCKYILHRSTFDRFITSQLSLLQNGENAQTLTFSDLLNSNDQTMLNYSQTGIEFISINSSLLDAKILLDNNPVCSDIIVTQNGNKDEDVVGWITDFEIAKNSRV